ncbi:MAG: Crp/Fnr family transcriptional regulator [Bacteroidota bacterium]
MFDLLRKHIEKRIHLSGDEFTLCTNFFIPKKVRKRQFLLQEGDVCKHLSFVNSGCLREYSIDHKGDEHILEFAIADWWISDINSFLSGSISAHNADALEDSDILMLTKDNRDHMFEAVPKMERFFRILIEAHFVAMRKRINESLSASAEERYLGFIKTYPSLVEQVPQNQIASYLGVTPQSLSRIRKELSRKH